MPQTTPIKRASEDVWESVRFKSFFPGDCNVQPGLRTSNAEQWLSNINECRHHPHVNAGSCKAYCSAGLGWARSLFFFFFNLRMILMMQFLHDHTLWYIDMCRIYHSACFMPVNQESHLLINRDIPVLSVVLLNPLLLSDTRGFKLLYNSKSNIQTHFTCLWQNSG